MQLRSEIQLATMIKAMRDVVIPALDPIHRLAVEQSQMVVGMLTLMQQQLPRQFAFDRTELQSLLQTLANVEAICESDHALAPDGLARRPSQVDAQRILDQARVDPRDLHQAVRALRAQLSGIVSQAAVVGGSDALRRIETEVLEMSRGQLLRDRAMLVSQGWEPGLRALPPIDELLREENNE